MNKIFRKKTAINWGSVRNYLLYTLGATILLGIVYSIFNIALYKPFIEPMVGLGTAASRLAYALQGVIVVLLVQPVRNLVEKGVHVFVKGRITDYEKVRDSIISVFVNQSTIEECISSIEKTFQDAFHMQSVGVILRFEGSFFEIKENKRERILHTHPLWKYFHKENASFGDVYYKDLTYDVHELAEYLHEQHIVYVLPIIADDQLFGWLTFNHKSPHYTLTYQDRVFLRSLDSALAVGLRRTTLGRHLEKRIEELVTLQHIGNTMNSSLNVKETLETVMDAVVQLTEVDRALMYMMQEDGTLKPTVGRGVEPDIALNFSIDITRSVFKWVVDNRQPIVVEDVDTDPRVNKEYAAYVKTKAFAAVPIVSKEKVLGIIGVDNLVSGKPISSINMPLLMTFANHVSIALANSKLYEKTQQFNAELQREVDEATKHLHSLLEMKSHFLTLASHQLRTPTTIVKGLLSMLEEDPDMPPEEQRKLIEQAFVSARRLERIISELLSATELEDSTIEPIIEKFDVRQLLYTIVNELQPLADKKKLNLRIEVQDNIQFIYSDEYKLKEALTNLVDNAIRYTQAGSVVVGITQEDTAYCIYVKDTGIGLEADELERIFEKFQRGAHISDIEPNGTGLGLFIAKRIVGVLGGTISAESNGTNTGSTFRIVLSAEAQE